MHPWEDWAETWAHYLHMIDTLETAATCGISIEPPRPYEPTLKQVPNPALGDVRFDTLVKSWTTITYVLNNLNRGLGKDGTSTRSCSPTRRRMKLHFIHDRDRGTIAESFVEHACAAMLSQRATYSAPDPDNIVNKRFDAGRDRRRMFRARLQRLAARASDASMVRGARAARSDRRPAACKLQSRSRGPRPRPRTRAHWDRIDVFRAQASRLPGNRTPHPAGRCGNHRAKRAESATRSFRSASTRARSP